MTVDFEVLIMNILISATIVVWHKNLSFQLMRKLQALLMLLFNLILHIQVYGLFLSPPQSRIFRLPSQEPAFSRSLLVGPNLEYLLLGFYGFYLRCSFTLILRILLSLLMSWILQFLELNLLSCFPPLIWLSTSANNFLRECMESKIIWDSLF